MEKENNKFKFTLFWSSSIFILLLMLVLGVNSSFKGTSAATEYCPSGYSENTEGTCCPNGYKLTVDGQSMCCPEGYNYYASGWNMFDTGCYKVQSETHTYNRANGSCENEDTGETVPDCKSTDYHAPVEKEICNGNLNINNECIVENISCSNLNQTECGNTSGCSWNSSAAGGSGMCTGTVNVPVEGTPKCYYVLSSNAYQWSNTPISGASVVADSNCGKCYYVLSSNAYQWSNSPISGASVVAESNCKKCYYVPSSNAYQWSYTKIEGASVVAGSNCEGGSNVLSCDPGEYANNGKCETCPANKYCPGATNKPVDCPSGKISNAGSSQLSDCVYPSTGPSTVTYTATFNENGGNLNGNSSKSCSTTGNSCTIDNLPTASKDGYTFTGWGTTESCTSGDKSTLTLSKNNTTFYACYTNNSQNNNNNVTDNPETGEIIIAFIWFVGIFAIVYAAVNFRKIEEN